MACRPSFQGNRLVMDCQTCGLGLGTSQCINSHLHTIATLEKTWKTMRYEEEMIISLTDEESLLFAEYVGIIRQVEQIMLNTAVYGKVEDEQYDARQRLLKEFYDTMFQNPQQAARVLKDYNEPYPEREVFMEGYKTFNSWVNGILDAYTKCRLYRECTKREDLRDAFLSILKLQSTPYSQTFIKQIPAGAKLIEGGEYELDYGIKVSIYEVPGSDTNLYVQEDASTQSLPKELTRLLADTITDQLRQTKENVDYTTIFESKMRSFRQQFLDHAAINKIPITPAQASAMAREAASWTVGLGSPIESLSLDRDNITDIYIDAENAPVYIEHQKFGLCHTLWQYNHEMLERAFRNIMATVGGTRKFDKENPVVDVVLTRLMMRCHLQRPPATFGELQAALRIMKEQPFTYAEYLKYKSFTPFFAGYDDVMVGLGCSEAVLGLKGVGKTAFTSAKIAAIGIKRRILPIQDIEEIPTRAYRKRGFHIGAVRVSSSDRDDAQSSSSELDLVSMTNASLRMGDSCVIINEIRSRTSIQGVINMLNTQPGIFLLYNLHAQSIKDIQDRLELVFGMPAASMYSTDRYSFLRKMRFGRKSRTYRVLGYQYETDLDKHQFTPVFTLKRSDTIDSTRLLCDFCEIPEASAKELYRADLGAISKKLKLKFIPPALKRRAEETDLPPQDYVMEAFYKGKLYDLVYHASIDTGVADLVELDFVLKCLTMANHLLKVHAGEEPDWSNYDKQLCQGFDVLLKQELSDLEATEQATGQKKTQKGAQKSAQAGARQQSAPLNPQAGARPGVKSLKKASQEEEEPEPKKPDRPRIFDPEVLPPEEDEEQEEQI